MRNAPFCELLDKIMWYPPKPWFAVHPGEFRPSRPEGSMILISSVWRFFPRYISAGICFWVFGASAGAAHSAEQGNADCVSCHTTPGLSTQFPSSENLPLTIDEESLKSSVHGTQRCTACHSGISRFPHPPMTAKDYREFQLQNSKQCENCHIEQAKKEQDSNHARTRAAGNRNAAVCTDCHGNHAVGKPGSPRYKISTSCGKCHGSVYAQYISSAHGRSLLETDNPDVPACSDCHEAHKQEDPTTQAFRLRSPKICARCHADRKLMRKYGISPDVFSTYVADFHGLTVTLFDRQHPDQRINTAVCTDCHGIHDIQKATDANAAAIKQNLVNACRKCHPDATTSFPDSWVGHFPPTRDRYPAVYWVNVFYRFLIPITIGGMIVYVLIDASGRIIRRFRRGR